MDAATMTPIQAARRLDGQAGREAQDRASRILADRLAEAQGINWTSALSMAEAMVRLPKGQRAILAAALDRPHDLDGRPLLSHGGQESGAARALRRGKA